MLGVISLERGLSPDAAQPEPLPGSYADPNVVGTPVIIEYVPGAWVENVVRGDTSVLPGYIAAARRLVSRGAIAITSNCGFTIRYQEAVAAGVRVPVALSSLLLLPGLLRQLPNNGKIAVLTYDSACFSDELLTLAGVEDRTQVVIEGIEGGKFWSDEMMKPPPRTDVRALIADVLACAKKVRDANSGIAIILLECASFPLAAKTVRRETGLPVYDMISLCKLTLGAIEHDLGV